jgi:hypothetical protein
VAGLVAGRGRRRLGPHDATGLGVCCLEPFAVQSIAVALLAHTDARNCLVSDYSISSP